MEVWNRECGDGGFISSIYKDAEAPGVSWAHTEALLAFWTLCPVFFLLHHARNETQGLLMLSKCSTTELTLSLVCLLAF